MAEKIGNRQKETPANYAKRFLEVKNHSDQLESISIAFLTSYTAEVLNPYISVELSKYRYYADNYFAPFNQFEQEVLNQKSNLYLKNPEVVILHNMIEDMYPDMISNFSKYNDSEIELIAQQLLDRYKAILETLRKQTKASIIVINFSLLNSTEDSSLYSTIHQRKDQFIQQVNKELLVLSNGISDCFNLDYMGVVLKLGVQKWIDRKKYALLAPDQVECL